MVDLVAHVVFGLRRLVRGRSDWRAKLNFLCDCGNAFKARLKNLTRNEHNGCKNCAHEANTAKRAWVLADAKAAVARRGYLMFNDPGSYVNVAMLVAPNGIGSKYGNILELAKALPIGAFGFGSVDLSSSAERTTILGVVDARGRSPGHPVGLATSHEPIAQSVYRSTLAGKKENSLHPKRIFDVNDSAFSTLTPEACYWAGLLAADGCITKREEVVLELQVRGKRPPSTVCT